ncbi:MULTISPECIES: tetratricopeptide repeat protein [Calothrix]|uniref:Tetratricopeptide repeat protein n=2 Tax=Calothrix TaxID=1186 RepID=A0ABR8AC17_9CYAN|nr:MULTISPECIES: tetratricopeptide repeat protein [Calothrix]MBD2196571.1 tetratricopeptide repeat protein [Calothrix parietina FACHB-288]MBD2228064.1 tetratricopeptide repeat protein [Calothrix anomala FACHB-343]
MRKWNDRQQLRYLLFMLTTAIVWQFSSTLTLAQNKKPQPPDKFPPSPIENILPDPLLTPLGDPKKLTPAQLQQLEPQLEQLNQQAAAQLESGDTKAAFDTWNRELRLRRLYGSLTEVQALSRVGGIAFSQNNREQVQYVTQRLQVIQQQTLSQPLIDLELLRSLGAAYEKVRSPKQALEAYNNLLTAVKQQKNTAAIIDTLKSIGEVHLGWFDYPQAAAAYQELLALATTQGDKLNEIAYLQQLAYIYEQAKNPQESINILSKLAEIYTSDNNTTQLPKLKMAIAANYQALAKENPALLPEAFKNYQAAYTTAWEQQQYFDAGEALQQLIALYRSQGQIEDALQTSQILIAAQTQASNYYGVMQAYDQMGQLYVQQKQYPQAITAFQKGLEIAQQLKYDETYFTQQIEKVSKGNL